MKSTKFWVILVLAILALSAAASVAVFHGRLGDSAAQIYQDGVCIQTIDLTQVDEPYSFTVEWEGGYNVIRVEPGRIRVEEADCPDQVCVRQGWLASGAVPIACLPHKLAIRLISASDMVDAAVG